MSRDDFDAVDDAAILLLEAEGVTALKTPDDVRGAVCDTKRQLLRHLTSVALNLAAGFVSASENLSGQDAPLGTVGDAFSDGARIYLMEDAAPRDVRNQIQDVLDRINNNENIDNACTPNGGEDGDREDGQVGTGGSGPCATACTVEPDGRITICHVPPGNPVNSKTDREF